MFHRRSKEEIQIDKKIYNNKESDSIECYKETIF